MSTIFEDLLSVGVIAAIFITYYCQFKHIQIKQFFKNIAEWYKNYGEDEVEE